MNAPDSAAEPGDLTARLKQLEERISTEVTEEPARRRRTPVRPAAPLELPELDDERLGGAAQAGLPANEPAAEEPAAVAPPEPSERPARHARPEPDAPSAAPEVVTEVSADEAAAALASAAEKAAEKTPAKAAAPKTATPKKAPAKKAPAKAPAAKKAPAKTATSATAPKKAPAAKKALAKRPSLADSAPATTPWPVRPPAVPPAPPSRPAAVPPPPTPAPAAPVVAAPPRAPRERDGVVRFLVALAVLLLAAAAGLGAAALVEHRDSTYKAGTVVRLAPGPDPTAPIDQTIATGVSKYADLAATHAFTLNAAQRAGLTGSALQGDVQAAQSGTDSVALTVFASTSKQARALAAAAGDGLVEAVNIQETVDQPSAGDRLAAAVVGDPSPASKTAPKTSSAWIAALLAGGAVLVLAGLGAVLRFNRRA